MFQKQAARAHSHGPQQATHLKTRIKCKTCECESAGSTVFFFPLSRDQKSKLLIHCDFLRIMLIHVNEGKFA